MNAKTRWTVLLLALACTLAAVAYPVEEQDVVVEVAMPLPQPKPELPTHSPEIAAPEIAWLASDDDPFAARAWQAPLPAAPEPAKQLSVAAPITAPPPPPPLPYKFVGQMNNGAERTVYLSRGDQVVIAHQGDVLDGSYKVVAIRSTQIEFETTSSGLKQMLAIPAQEK